MASVPEQPDRSAQAARNRAALDWLNFLLADVQAGLGPFLAIFLLSGHHWDPGRIGIVLTISGLATVLARAPVGAAVDGLRFKRGLVAAGALAVGAAGILTATWPRFWPVAAAQLLSGAADAVFPSAIAAMSLGIVGRRLFSRRVGRNEAFNHAGNVVTAAIAGLAGYLIDPAAVLWIVALLALASIAAAGAIRAEDIDHRLARGCGDSPAAADRGMPALLTDRRFLLFTAAITLFHFANAAMLPLVGEKLSRLHQQAGSLFMAACIIAAQAVMVPVAVLVGRKTDGWGRKGIFLAGFAVLPLRGLLYTLTQDPAALIAIQLLDGLGAGIFGVLFPILVDDLTRATGRYNLALGVSSACWGLGAALSNGTAGLIVERAGFSAAFLFLAGCAALALLVFATGVPETRPRPEPGSVEFGVLAARSPRSDGPV